MSEILKDNKQKIVVYTAISNNYDSLRLPITESKDIDFICFTDNDHLKSDKWKIIKIEDQNLDPVRLAKKVKVLPHLFLSEYDFSFWVDANFLITHDLNELFNTYLNKEQIACFQHPYRNCIYEEAEACKDLKRDKKSIIEKQMSKYQSLKYPEKNGLISSGGILRQHNDPKIIKLSEDWWKEIVQFSIRDQLSFNYAAWKNKIQYTVINESIENNKYFKIKGHQKTYYFQD
ncbi:glycosyltransferase domain-containing protein [Peribacillus simplex]|uniref:TOD1/MUCI70 glycosyltransferase-like domain-containing protein n=1 Tax=Peribacillus simplex NBRC 15720 = DSM 1321 TaxID=1349754 RepID=A0A223ENK8_9BACI|nr:glycosyltransferase domain-containing protein [Peribacillus simplex]ASS96791.1 hypothetical protein BS1321_24520 [Peribacillus simplex NBRC 15720 = DSM 1321]MEC1395792.1 DUF616 domain-containing protein [Peribacillus simplex]MED3909881.1 DUF616 domain-containing protein [Peribacillus simplex]